MDTQQHPPIVTSPPQAPLVQSGSSSTKKLRITVIISVLLTIILIVLFILNYFAIVFLPTTAKIILIPSTKTEKAVTKTLILSCPLKLSSCPTPREFSNVPNYPTAQGLIYNDVKENTNIIANTNGTLYITSPATNGRTNISIVDSETNTQFLYSFDGKLTIPIDSKATQVKKGTVIGSIGGKDSNKFIVTAKDLKENFIRLTPGINGAIQVLPPSGTP